jgi:DNA-binding beta-propeller fold protein YncE
MLYGAGPYVVDVDRKRVITTLADTTAWGGFVLAPELGRGLVRNGTVFALASGETIRRLVARGDASVYDPTTGRAFLLEDSVSVIDLKSASLITKISIGGAGESGVTDGRGRIYLNLIGKDSIAVIDAKTFQRVAEYSVGPSKSPMGLAIDSNNGRLFAACDGQVVVLDATNGRIVATIPSPGHSDQNAFDPGTGLLFEPGGKSGMTIIHEDSPDKYSVVQTLVDSRATSVRVVVDLLSHAVYMPHFTVDKRFTYLVLTAAR